MKKIVSLILLLGLILSFAACGGEVEITMQEIYDASILNTALENHDSVYVKNISDGVVYEETYVTKDYSYSVYAAEFYGLSTDMAFLTADHAMYSYGNGDYTRSILLTPEGLTDTYRTGDESVVILGMDTVNETIESVTEEDNRITVTSYLPIEDGADSEEFRLVSMNCEYVLDAKTRELISSRSVSNYSDESVYDISSEYYYDAELPEYMKAFLAFDTQTEDLRTITIVSNPGTENEKTESIQVPKGLSVSLEPASYDDEMFSMYADEACTEFMNFFEDNESDATVYIKWDN